MIKITKEESIRVEEKLPDDKEDGKRILMVCVNYHDDVGLESWRVRNGHEVGKEKCELLIHHYKLARAKLINDPCSWNQIKLNQVHLCFEDPHVVLEKAASLKSHLESIRNATHIVHYYDSAKDEYRWEGRETQDLISRLL